MVRFDATCSGLQHIAAIMNDEVLGELVNLSPNKDPSDAYNTIANITAGHIGSLKSTFHKD